MPVALIVPPILLGRGEVLEDLAHVNAGGGAVQVNGITFVPEQCDRAHITEHSGMLRLGIHAQLSLGHGGECGPTSGTPCLASRRRTGRRTKRSWTSWEPSPRRRA